MPNNTENNADDYAANHAHNHDPDEAQNRRRADRRQASTADTWLRSAALADGRVVDVGLDSVGGTIVDVVDARRGSPRGANVAAPRQPDDIGMAAVTEVDLEGYLLLPAPAEPHAHLDKALTSDLVPNPRGDLLGAIEAWVDYIPHITVDGMVERARTAVLELVASGVTAIRSHANVHEGIDTDAVEALLIVRDELAHLVDIQIVALVGFTTGEHGREQIARMHDALRMDDAIIVGGCPHLEVDPDAASDLFLATATELGRDIDLHTDETLNTDHLDVRYLARRVVTTGFAGRAVASHCVSLGMQPSDVQHAVAAEIAAAGISVVALPQTNLFLQGRDHPTSPPRGLTALRPLLNAGVTVGAGADNVRDPFNSMGRSDAFETAALLVMAGHLLPAEAYTLVTTGARAAMGLQPVEIKAGAPGELVAVLGANLDDALARADQQRMVWHRGRLVASTTVGRLVLTGPRTRTTSRRSVSRADRA